jgi:hypothetical protein
MELDSYGCKVFASESFEQDLSEKEEYFDVGHWFSGMREELGDRIEEFLAETS